MLKLLIIAVIVIAVSVAVYYGRFLFTQKVVSEEMPKMMDEAARTVKQGDFKEIDFIHKGSGKALLLEDGSGHRIIRLESFKVTNGPDLYVYLSKNPVPGKNKQSLGDFVSLGQLKGNVGDQNYNAPADAGDYESIVIWCQRFSALFSYATLQ